MSKGDASSGWTYSALQGPWSSVKYDGPKSNADAGRELLSWLIKIVFWAMFTIYFISLGVVLYWNDYIPKESLVFMLLIPTVSF